MAILESNRIESVKNTGVEETVLGKNYGQQHNFGQQQKGLKPKCGQVLHHDANNQLKTHINKNEGVKSRNLRLLREIFRKIFA